MAKSKAGMSDLAKIEQRLAYWLLLPTFVIMIAIAIYPLLSVLYNSFTNNVFASSQPTQFVQFNNYLNLLDLTIKEVPPKVDAATGKPQVDPTTGKIQYQSAVSVLPRAPRRFKQVEQFNLFGNQYVLGA